MYPGPGHYPPAQATSKTGSYFLSKFKSSQCRTFGVEYRDTLTSRGDFVTSPGPGTYRAPSDFGHYEAQAKYIEEAKRVEMIATSPRLKNGRRPVKSRIASNLEMARSKSQPSITNKEENKSLEDEINKETESKKPMIPK